MGEFAIKDGYTPRTNNDYYDDETGNKVWQPDVYTAAVALARRLGASAIIDIGSGSGAKLAPHRDEFDLICVDHGRNLDVIVGTLGSDGNTFIDCDLDEAFPTFEESALRNAVVVCSDVIEHLKNPAKLAEGLVRLSASAPFVVVSTPERIRTRGIGDYGPPGNPGHVREWSMEEFDTYLRSLGMRNHLIGATRSNDRQQARETIAMVAGTYLNDLAHGPREAFPLRVTYKAHAPFAQKYYAAQGIAIASDAVASGLTVRSNEWLASPHPSVTIGAICRDATAKGFGVLDAQVIDVDSDAAFDWPSAGLVSRGQGLIGRLAEMRRFEIGAGGRTYPLQLTLLRQVSGRTRFAHALRARRLIDIGHLADDFLLESLVSFNLGDESRGPSA